MGCGEREAGRLIVTAAPRPKAGAERQVRIAWEIFADCLFDTDAFKDEDVTTISLKQLDRIARISQDIASPKR